MLRFFKWFVSVFALLTVVYFVGPTPKEPKLNPQLPDLSTGLDKLEQEINTSEKKIPKLKPNNQARIIWYDSLQKKKSPFSVVYIHGFSASQAEGSPIHYHFARRFGCNLYLARLDGHGINDTEVFLKISPESLLESAKKAINIGKELGDKVIVIATSTGATLAFYLASKNPEIAAIIAYSPLIDFYSSALYLLDKPWGLQISRLVTGGKYQIRKSNNKKLHQYWTNKFRLEGAIALKSLVVETMQPETFHKIKQPVFLGYYYKDEEHQDNTVSVKAMLKMFEELGTKPALKRQRAFPKARHHVIGSSITSNDWKGVQNETYRFAEEVLKLKVMK